jgi:hypothetical protein
MWAAAIPLVALLIAVLAIAAGWRMRTSPVAADVSRHRAAEPRPAPGFLKTTRGRVLVFVPLTLLLVGLWLAFDLSIAILPAVILPIWVTQFADQDLSPAARRRMGIAMLLLGVLFLATIVLGVAVFLAR